MTKVREMALDRDFAWGDEHTTQYADDVSMKTYTLETGMVCKMSLQ